MSIISKLKKNSKIKETQLLSESPFFAEKDKVDTGVPMLNVALSGDIDGGLTSGLTVIAGQSRYFKTSYALVMASAFLKQYDDSVLLFYDSEFGAPQDYFKTFDIPLDRVLHVPITNVEELKFDIVSQLENIDKEDKVIIIIDSIGNLASKKEVEDALNEKSVADMTRAKALKGLFRMVTPYLTMKDIPLVAINHVYSEMGLFPKTILSGGQGIMLAANTVFFINRRQNKTGQEVTGYEFVIKVEKSRFVKEGAKIPIIVTWEGGIEKYSGLLDIAMQGGYVVKPSNGWYAVVDRETGEVGQKVRLAKTMEKEFWEPVLEKTDFKQFVKKMYSIGYDSEAINEFLSEEG